MLALFLPIWYSGVETARTPKRVGGMLDVGRWRKKSYIKGRFPLVPFGNGPHRAIYIRPYHIVSHLCCFMSY